jgi:hypothetical protein
MTNGERSDRRLVRDFPEARYHGTGGSWRGSAGRCGRPHDRAGTLHLTLNAVIDASGPEPSVDNVMLMVTSGPSPVIVGSAKVRQVVTRRPEGWRISRRTIRTGTG